MGQLAKRDIEDKSDIGIFPSVIVRERIILDNMPKEFALEDVVKYFMDKYKYYDIKYAKERLSCTLQKMKHQNKVEIINPDANRRYRKYRKLVDNIDSDIMIDDQKEDNKVSIENKGSQ